MSKLYLLPNLLGDTEISDVLPQRTIDIILSLDAFATEDIRNTRRFLKRIDKSLNIDSFEFIELNEHSDSKQVESCIQILKKKDMGIISEAGCPGIADPGANLVAAAHSIGIQVIPLVGPSSILLALMASGCSGQHFSFNGYLPVKSEERIRALREYEKESMKEDRSEVFIETPYRNIKLFQEILTVLAPTTNLCIACDITTSQEYIQTLSVLQWKQKDLPPIEKRPTIFIIYASKSINVHMNIHRTNR